MSKDFGTTATDISTNVTSLGLNTDMSLVRSLRTSVDISYTETAFLDLLGAGRRDTLWQFTANLGTALTTHIRTNLAYSYMINYSNLSGASFTRQTLSLNITAQLLGHDHLFRPPSLFPVRRSPRRRRRSRVAGPAGRGSRRSPRRNSSTP